MTDWLKPNHVTISIKKKKKRRGMREPSERTKRDNNVAQKVGLEKNVAERKRAKGSDEECIRRGWSGRVKVRG